MVHANPSYGVTVGGRDDPAKPDLLVKVNIVFESASDGIHRQLLGSVFGVRGWSL